MQRPVVSAHFPGTGTRPILLLLDSGSDGPILLPGSEQPGIQTLIHDATLQGGYATVAQRAFAVVPPVNIQIGNRILKQITFVTPVRVAKNLTQMVCSQPCSSSESLSATGTITSSSIPSGAGEGWQDCRASCSARDGRSSSLRPTWALNGQTK
jgi:hypothetical protein